MCRNARRLGVRVRFVELIQRRGEPQRTDCVGERSSCRAIVGDHLVGRVGEPQHRRHPCIAHRDDEANPAASRMRTRRKVSGIVVVDRCSPTTRQHDGGIEHLGDRTRRRLEQFVDVTMFGEEGDAQGAVDVVGDPEGLDDGDP